MEIGVIEGAITLLFFFLSQACFKHSRAHCDLHQKFDYLHEINTVQRVNALEHPVKVSSQGAV